MILDFTTLSDDQIRYLLSFLKADIIEKGEITKDAFTATPEDFEQKLEDNSKIKKRTFGNSSFRGSSSNSRRGSPRQRR